MANSNFRRDFTSENFHPNTDVNALIRKGRNNEIDVKQMISKIEDILGSQGTWETYDIVSEYRSRSITFDQLIVRYFELNPLRLQQSDEQAEATNAIYFKMVEQRKAYEDNCPEPTDKMSILQVNRYVSSDIYKFVIFFSDPKEVYMQPNFLASPQDETQAVQICNIILSKLKKDHYSLTQKINWWLAYRTHIRKYIPQCRSRTIRSINVAFTFAYKRWKEDDEPDNGFSGLIRLCEEDVTTFGESILDFNINKDIYKSFIDICFSVFYNKSDFMHEMRTKLLSDVISPPEEAFGILCFENNYERWKWNASSIPEEPLRVGSIPPLRYQHNIAQAREDSNKVTGGSWTVQGLERMNELLSMVVEKREQRSTFEQELRRMYFSGIDATELETGWMSSRNNGHSRSKKRKTNHHVAVRNFLK